MVGDDGRGREVLDLLKKKGIDSGGVLCVPGVETTCKTRILAGGVNTAMQQVIRVDREWEGDIPEDVLQRLDASLREMAEEADAILVSDYGLGTVGTRMIEAVNALAKEKSASNGGLPILVDSRHRLGEFRGVTAVTPNEPEMREILGGPAGEESLFRESDALRERMGIGGLLLTRGKKGMVLFEADREPQTLDIFGGDDVADVTGAGDTVIGTFALSMAAGAGMWDSARLANIAGGLVVMKRGTATVSRDELLEVL
jgi:rfaE bifunctional protein kinase chain/domain